MEYKVVVAIDAFRCPSARTLTPERRKIKHKQAQAQASKRKQHLRELGAVDVTPAVMWFIFRAAARGRI